MLVAERAPETQQRSLRKRYGLLGHIYRLCTPRYQPQPRRKIPFPPGDRLHKMKHAPADSLLIRQVLADGRLFIGYTVQSP